MNKFLISLFLLFFCSLGSFGISFGGIDFSEDTGDMADSTAWTADDFSIALLFKADSFVNGGRFFEVSKTGGTYANAVWVYTLSATSNIRADILAGNESALTIDTDTTINVGEWYWYFLIYDDAPGVSKAYINTTVQADTGTASSARTGDSVNRYIGDSPGQAGLDGTIAEFYGYSKKLSVAEIEQIANSKVKGIGMQISSCKIALLFNEGSGGSSSTSAISYDRSGNGNNVTFFGGVWTSESVLSYP